MKSKFEKTGKNLALLVNAFMEKGCILSELPIT